jgi:NADH-quinone oxidoreductase subunit M
MILLILILLLIAGGLVAWITGRLSPLISQIVTIATVLAGLIIVVFLISGSGPGIVNEYSALWIPHTGIGIHLSADGLSLLLLLLTFFIGLIAVITGREKTGENPGFYNFNILLTLAGISGVFISADLFLFYFFWELMIVPMYFIISIWGNGNRIKASYKFFIYTQASGLLMLLSITGLYLIHGNNTGIYTFNIQDLAGTIMPKTAELLLMAGFLAAFLVKLPAFLLHTWQPDSYSEAPMAGTIILACLMSKTAAYALIRFAIPLFPNASAAFAPYGMALGVAGILYGAKLAYSQTDFKRLIAYTSLSHMGFVLIGVYSFNEIAWQGVVMQMITHGLSTCAMFLIAGWLYGRMKTWNINEMGGLWTTMPSMGAMGLFFSMALLGLPGLGNFIAEFLTLAGAFTSSILFTSIACLGLVLSTVYALRIMQKIFFGKETSMVKGKDLTMSESIVIGLLVITVVITGLFPQPVINSSTSAIRKSLSVGKKNDQSKITETLNSSSKPDYGQN